LSYDPGDQHGKTRSTSVNRWMVYDVDFQTEKIRWSREFVMLLPIGLLLLGVATLKASVYTGWRRAVPFGFGLTLLLLILAALTVMVVSGPRTQEGLLGAILFAIAAGWVVLGYALWSERSEAS
jgi:hypothetical protein